MGAGAFAGCKHASAWETSNCEISAPEGSRQHRPNQAVACEWSAPVREAHIVENEKIALVPAMLNRGGPIGAAKMCHDVLFQGLAVTVEYLVG